MLIIQFGTKNIKRSRSSVVKFNLKIVMKICEVLSNSYGDQIDIFYIIKMANNLTVRQNHEHHKCVANSMPKQHIPRYSWTLGIQPYLRAVLFGLWSFVSLRYFPNRASPDFRQYISCCPYLNIIVHIQYT